LGLHGPSEPEFQRLRQAFERILPPQKKWFTDQMTGGAAMQKFKKYLTVS
jgi:hypothetical protein